MTRSKSMLVESLGIHTNMKVQEVKNTVSPKEGNIYLAPPDRELVMRKGKFYLKKSHLASGLSPSIDKLLLSLAGELKDRSIGIILSGSGSDGSAGIKEIK